MARATPLTGITPHMPLSEAARLVVKYRTDDLATWAKFVHDPAAVTELHNMRIAAKRLRYSMELLEPVLPPQSNALVDTVQQLQEKVGDVHDDDVLLARLARFATVEAVRGAESLTQAIVRSHGSLELEGGQASQLHELYGLLSLVARRRQEKFLAFQEWWNSQDDLVERLAALAATPEVVLSALPA